MTTKINRILFDYDGTLIIHDKEGEGLYLAERLGIKEELVGTFVTRLKYFFESSYGRQYYDNKKISYKLYYSILNDIIKPWEFGMTAKQVDFAINKKSCAAIIEPTAIETLEYLRDKGYQLCIFTNGFLKEQTENMKQHRLYEYFERIYAWDGYYAKPDERALIRALGGTSPENNIMVGDSLTNDIAPAKALGIYTIGINTCAKEQEGIIPDMKIETLSELKTIL